MRGGTLELAHLLSPDRDRISTAFMTHAVAWWPGLVYVVLAVPVVYLTQVVSSL